MAESDPVTVLVEPKYANRHDTDGEAATSRRRAD